MIPLGIAWLYRHRRFTAERDFEHSGPQAFVPAAGNGRPEVDSANGSMLKRRPSTLAALGRRSSLEGNSQGIMIARLRATAGAGAGRSGSGCSRPDAASEL